MGQQPPGIVLKGRGNGFCPEAALNAFQQLQVVTDDHIGPLRQQQLHAVDLRSAGADLDVETVFLYSPVASGLIIPPPVPPSGVPRRSAERFSPRPERPARHRRGPSGPASVCPGKACACFHYPSPLYAGRERANVAQPPIPVNIEPRHGD